VLRSERPKPSTFVVRLCVSVVPRRGMQPHSARGGTVGRHSLPSQLGRQRKKMSAEPFRHELGGESRMQWWRDGVQNWHAQGDVAALRPGLPRGPGTPIGCRNDRPPQRSRARSARQGTATDWRLSQRRSYALGDVLTQMRKGTPRDARPRLADESHPSTAAGGCACRR
jgi:hypothetical protein